MRAVVVGVGHLGQHHARILATLPGVTLAGVVDTDLARAGRIAAERETKAYADVSEVPGKIDVAVVAVPTESHARVAQGVRRWRGPKRGSAGPRQTRPPQSVVLGRERRQEPQRSEGR